MKKIVLLLLLFTGFLNAQTIVIPDANFKTKLIQLGVDTNSDGNIQVSEAQFITNELNVNGSSITDLTGFEAFTNVPVLRCSNNNLNLLSISNMPNLRTIDCGFNPNLNALNITNVALDSLKVYNNNLSNLNVDNLTTLKHLDCSYNFISNLNISSLTNLKVLNCNRNQLMSLNLATLVNLEKLEFALNQITTIDVSPLVNLKRLVCYNNFMPALNVNNLASLEYLDCKNNNSTSILFNGLTNLKYFDCSGNNLSNLDVSILNNLENLKCNNNNLNSINLNGLIHLQFLTVANNQLTNINLSSLAALDYFSCVFNQITSINFTGLTSISAVYVSNNLINDLIINNLSNLTVLYCDNNQLSTLNLTGSTNLNFLYCNDNLLSSLLLSGSTQLSWIDCHENLLTTIDFTGLTSLQTILCDNNQLTSLDFSTCPVLANLSCSYNSLITMNIKNGYQYINPNNFWHENPNLTFICADDGDLPFLNQILNLSQNVNNGNVVYNSYCSFVPGGNFNTITGTLTFDSNNNGCDTSDVNFPNIKVNINDGVNQGATFTNLTGNYTFYTQAGGFAITPNFENPTWFTVSPTTATIPFANNNSNVANQNFCISANGIHPDLEVVIAPISAARPGFDAVYKIVYKNKGNQSLSGNIAFLYDEAVLDFVIANVATNTQSNGSLNWSYVDLLPFEERSIYVTLNVNSPQEIPAININDILSFQATITPVVQDEIPTDNLFVYNQTVVGSYDPNDIVCLQGEVVTPAVIGDYLHYIVNFENTGTAQAENVVLRIDIDPAQFNVNSLQIIETSHNTYIRQTENRIEFIFEEIYLDTGGHGNVLLKIKTLNSLQEGAIVAKKANIFFDYNFPIETNMANTTFQNLSNPNFQIDGSISMYPNPTNSIVTINCNNSIQTVQLYDVQGRLLETQIVNNQSTTVDISQQSNGIYFVKVISDQGIKVEKVVKN